MTLPTVYLLNLKGGWAIPPPSEQVQAGSPCPNSDESHLKATYGSRLSEQFRISQTVGYQFAAHYAIFATVS